MLTPKSVSVVLASGIGKQDGRYIIILSMALRNRIRVIVFNF